MRLARQVAILVGAFVVAWGCGGTKTDARSTETTQPIETPTPTPCTAETLSKSCWLWTDSYDSTQTIRVALDSKEHDPSKYGEVTWVDDDATCDLRSKADSTEKSSPCICFNSDDQLYAGPGSGVRNAGPVSSGTTDPAGPAPIFECRCTQDLANPNQENCAFTWIGPPKTAP